MAAIFATAPVGLSVLSLDGRFLRVNDELCRILGRSREAMLELRVPDVTHPDDVPPSLVAIGEALSTGRPATLDKRYTRPDGSLAWASSTLSVLPKSDGQSDRLLVVTADLSERRKSDEALRRSAALQRVLIAELQHRTSNLLGVVRSIVENTARGDGARRFPQAFDDRLDALSRVQALLSRLNEHDRVTFDELLHAELVAMDGCTDAVTLEGPSGVRLRSSTVHTLAMAIHELATNAMKYGALVRTGAAGDPLDAGGRGRGRQAKAAYRLRESSVRMPSEASWPTGTGQGRELIERALPYQSGRTDDLSSG